MITYYNKKTGEYYYEGRSITRRLDDGRIFAGVPTEQQLAEWGFEELVEPTPPEPTEQELKQLRMSEILTELAQTDYLALKAFEGEDMTEHPGWKEKRAALRAEYRQLESEVKDV